MSKNTVCMAPWMSLHTWPNNNVYPCCMTPSENPVGSLNEMSLEEIWNNDSMKTLRKEMLNGVQPETCKRCFLQESVGQESLRNILNTDFEHLIPLLDQTEEDGSLEEMNIAYWDFRFSNICNMRCRSCGPQLSTGWYDDTKKIWGSLPDDIPERGKNINMWEEIQPFFDSVEQIYFAGGEPLIMEEHYRILKKLDDKKMYSTSLRYNTNFSQFKYKSLNVLDIWPKFERVQVGASIDGYGPKAEYIRKGTVWSIIEENRKELAINAPNVEFFANFTISVLNAYHVLEFYEWAVSNEFISPHGINFNLVQHPEHLSLQIFPEKMKKDLTEKYTAAANNTTEENVSAGFKSLIEYMNSEDKSHLIPKFKESMLVLDRIRNENILDVLPELSELYI